MDVISQPNPKVYTLRPSDIGEPYGAQPGALSLTLCVCFPTFVMSRNYAVERSDRCI
jgi:hypothetical protein